MLEYILLNPYTYIDGKQWHAYVTDELPDKKLPRGFYLVHNQVQPQRPLGKKGFRAWVQPTRTISSSTSIIACG